MSQPGYGPPPATGERWNVNMPAVIGVVFVFLLGVIIWVITSSGGDPAAGDVRTVTGASTTGLTVPPTVGPTAAPTAATETTSAAPMPDLTQVTAPVTASTSPASTSPPTTSPATTSPPTTTPTTTPTTSPPTTAPTTVAPTTTEAGSASGDLGIDGHPMRRPDCDGSYITVLASAIGAEATAAGIENVLDSFAGSSYLRTDRACPSLAQSVGGQPIYVVYLGPVGSDTDACAARSRGPDDAYVRRLSDELGPDHSVVCT